MALEEPQGLCWNMRTLVESEGSIATAISRNAWFQEKAREIEIGMLSGGSRRNVWNSLREI